VTRADGRARRQTVRAFALVAALTLVTWLSPSLAAQQPKPRPAPQPAPSRPMNTGRPGEMQDASRLTRITAADTLGAAPRDTVDRREKLVDWTPDDSVMLALRARAGYTVVRYQAQDVGFAASGRTMTLTGKDSVKAVVQRDSTMLVADSISYSDSLKLVIAKGDTIVMRDPAQASDVLGHRELSYDVERREGKTRDFSTVANSGEDWSVQAERAAFVTDSSSDGRHIIYGRDGRITSCLDSLPHYHFLARELKRVSGSVIVARPAILYVQDVPVMWLPFIFQDIRTGRRSGMLPPRVGFAELVRNSPTYRRTVENIGYYFALTDYIDAQLSMDWRSSARATEQDPGWTRYNGELRYRWLDRFMSGSLALSQNSLSSGNRNTAMSWTHAQEFSARTRLNANLNYVTSTQVQRQTMFNPMAAVATIASQLNLVRQQGPFTVNLGGTQRQYPGRDQIDRSFPSLNIASKPLELGRVFVMTPSFSLSTQQSLNLDASGDFAYRYIDRAGTLDSLRLTRNTSTTAVTLGTPFKIFDFQVQSGLRFNNAIRDYPQIITVRDPLDTAARVDRVYASTYESSVDFDVSIGLPQFLQGTWNIAPTISAGNVDPRGFAIRTHLSNGAWVTQTKRLSYGVGMSPTVFRLFRGFGRVERFRHAVTPTLSWSYSPAATVSDEYLAATNQVAAGYLGSLAQNRLTLGFSTNIEAKLRVPGDSADADDQEPGAGQKLKVVTLQFSSLSWDFERARATGKSGFATDGWGYTFRSDLLPGFDLGVDYSLFQGNFLSDTAVFKPYRTAIRAAFSLDGNSAVVRGVARLFGREAARPTGEAVQQGAGGLVSTMGPQQGMGAITGTRARGMVQEIPTGQGFTASFNVSANRQRPPVGGRIREFDATTQCAGFLVGTFVYDECVRQAGINASTRDPNDLGASGGTYFRVPPTTSVGFRTSFNLTPKWAASWSTMYDVERSEFASQVVTLQRELHDWKAIFGFTQAPNGNFAFTFFISLKAQPEIKVDYDRATYRPPVTARTP
jgi:LptD protein